MSGLCGGQDLLDQCRSQFANAARLDFHHRQVGVRRVES